MVLGASVTIFAISCLVALGSWGFLIIEHLRIHRFDEAIFRLGRPVLRKRLALPRPSADLVSAGTTAKDEGMFKFIDERKCLFASKGRWFSLVGGRRVFKLKVTAVWEADDAGITARLPLGPTLFMLSFFCAWTAAGVFTCVLKSIGYALLPLLWGWGIGLWVVFSHMRVESKSMDRMIAELQEILHA